MASAREKETTKHPSAFFCPETQRYRIGLYVRDGVVGVGTLSFWDPQTSKYAALGHVIVDADTRKIDVRQANRCIALFKLFDWDGPEARRKDRLVRGRR